MAEPKKQSWVVLMECIIRKEVVLSDCTRQEALTEPWEHAESETELDQVDWEVLSVKPNV